jgi:epoxyqueuosine reductase QueG
MTALELKELAYSLGADLCGIAPVSRFEGAPEGFRPTDIFPAARSVVVFARKEPLSVFKTPSAIPLTFVDDMSQQDVMRITYELSVRLERAGVSALPVPSIPYDYWDADTMTGKGLMSFRHAGWLAGLGVIGRNRLLCHPTLGNMIKLGVLLAEADWEPDPVIEYDFCSDKCNLCLKQCPSGALQPDMILQKNCRNHSEGETSKGAPVTVCYNCRKVCPFRGGWVKGAGSRSGNPPSL